MKDTAIKAYKNGLSMNQAAKLVGVVGQTVKSWLEDADVPIRYSRPTYSEDVKNKAIGIYLERKISAAAVAEIMGLKCHTVKQWLRDGGHFRSMSEAAVIDIARGGARGRRGDVIWYKSDKTGETHACDSSYEYVRMRQLDMDDTVKYWSRCKDCIKYKSPCGKTRRYNPDLYVELTGGEKHVEEVKPTTMVNDEVNLAKAEAAKTHYEALGIGYKVITESELGNLKIKVIKNQLRPDMEKRAQKLRAKRIASETCAQKKARVAKNTKLQTGWVNSVLTEKEVELGLSDKGYYSIARAVELKLIDAGDVSFLNISKRCAVLSKRSKKEVIKIKNKSVSRVAFSIDMLKLAIASFRESGTNVSTGYLVIRKQEARP